MEDAEHRVARPLAATLFAQALIAMGLFTVAVLAERIAPEIGVSKSLVGYYVALIFLGAGVTSFFSGGPIARIGPVRAIQLGILLSIPALLLTNVAQLWLLPLSALLLGIGYGPFTVAASRILARATAPRWRGLIFSIKQSGAPLGGLLAGIVLPMLEKPYGWRIAVWCMAGLLLLTTCVLQAVRSDLDAQRSRAESISPARAAAALRKLLSNPNLRQLTITSFVYAMVQMSLFSLLIVYLTSVYTTDAGENDLILAGSIYSSMQLGGIFARVAWGWLADRFENPRLIFSGLGIGGGLATLAIAKIDPSWSLFWVHTVCLVAGTTVSGWNGLYLAELSRSGSHEEIGDTVGSALLFTYSGLVVGAALCTSLILIAESYQTAFAVMGSLSLVAGLWILLSRDRSRVKTQRDESLA